MENTQTGAPKLIVVIGASAGGLNSVVEFCAQLTSSINASVFIVLHLAKVSSMEVLVSRIQRNTEFTCKVATHNEPINAGHIYLAPSDRHLLVKKDKMILGDGPPENRWRPSIDVLFRSAAAAYNSRVIGIVLTGLLQDGTAGMLAIKRSGGTSIVQDPNEAEYPDMPLSVINNVQVDYCVPLIQMGSILQEKSNNGTHGEHHIPDDIVIEAAIAERVAIGIDEVMPIGERSLFTCPDCGGGLWEMKADDIHRYRCFTGHVYNQAELLAKQGEALESTLWVALRMLEERKNLLEKMAKEENSKGWTKSATNKKERAKELEEHVDRLKNLLFDAKKD